MTDKSKFVSERLSGCRLFLSFEKVGDSYWTEVDKLRALVAELDNLEVPDSTNVELKHRTSDDELRPPGWSLNVDLTVRATAAAP